MTDVINDVVINYESKNLDQTVGGIKQTSVALDGLVVASTSTERATASLENKFAGLERRFGTTAAQTAQYEKIQKDVNLAVANNPALQDRANEVLKAAEARYLGAGVAVKALAEAHKGLDAQGQAALHSVRSVVEQLALGIPPTQALTGQLNHLTFAATGEGGLAGAFGQVGGLVKNLVSPMTVAIGVVGGLTAALAVLANQYDKVQVSSQRAIGGAGGRTGTTASDLNSFTSQNASISGLSSKDARALGEDLTATGDIVISKLHGMSDAVVGFANQTNKSVGDSIKEFVKFGADPKKAMEELSAAFGPVDQHTRDLVDLQSLSIDKTAALNTVLDAYADKLKKAADNATILGKAWQIVSNGWNSTDFAKASGPENQIEAVRAKLNAAIGEATDVSGRLGPDDARTAVASQSVQTLSKQFEDLQQKREAAIGATATAQLNALDTEAGRAASQVATIAKFWGDVGTSTALALNTLYQQAAIAGQVTGQQQQAAQYAADFANASLQGKTAIEAESIASAKLTVSQASATASVEKQVKSLEDQNAMIKAQQKGTEATTAAAIAYKNAIESGASEASAAALQSQMLANYTLQAAQATADWRAAMIGVGSAVQVVGANLSNVLALQQQIDQSTASYNAQQIAAHTGSGTGDFFPITMPNGQLSFSSDPNARVSYTGGGGGKHILPPGYNEALFARLFPDIPATDLANNTLLADSSGAEGAIAAIQKAASVSNTQGPHVTGATSALQTLYGIKNQGADNATQITNDQQFLSWLQGQPQTVDNLKAMADLTSQIQSLANATNANTGATNVNTDALSPYYTQDPRTSHIGFRSQGMASGGEITVPGGYSANDNMIAQIPVASGEIVSVRRPGQNVSGSSQTFSVVNHITIAGNASKDEVLRTSYQLGQTMARQLASVGR